MGSSISIDLSYGILISEDNICHFPWSTVVDIDNDCFYDPSFSFMDDFDGWAPNDCPLEVDCWGDYRWGEDYYILKVKGVDQTSYGDILIPDWKKMEEQTGKLAAAGRWAKEHGVEFTEAQWMIVPSYG